MNKENEKIEIQLLLEGVYQKYGYDFKGYSFSHLQRRILHTLDKANLKNISELQHKVLYDKDFFHMLLNNLSINVTEMFRNPSFFQIVRDEIIPVLKSYPFIKIWVAGCSTGEEAYSLAIILKEEGLLKKSLIYATDFNENVLTKAREGIYDGTTVESYRENYNKAGGKGKLDEHFTEKYGYVILKEDIKKNIVFAGHNLVTDSVFGEMHLIICRNVFIYFERELQDKVIKLFLESLCTGGFLGLGTKEDIRFSKFYNSFNVINKQEKLYQKKFL